MAELPPVPTIEEARRPSPMAPYDIALIIDNTVSQVINADGQYAAQMLAQPLFVQVNRKEVSQGDVYDPETGTFSTPVIEE